MAWSRCAAAAAWGRRLSSSGSRLPRVRPRREGPMTRKAEMNYEDVLYEVEGAAAIITINREDRLNAFRGKTIEELIHAFKRAWADRPVRGVILTGAGTRAFCVGGDVKQRALTGDYGPTENGLFEATYLHRLI